jgi:surface carbohydrate biosynthesis protein
LEERINFYIPVEIKSRELYSKILLAKYAVQKGFNVILGRKNEINKIVTKMPPGIYYGLGVVKNLEPFYKRLSEQGHFIVVNDEEGLVTFSDEMYLSSKVSSETLKSVDLLIAWGKENFNVISTGRPEITPKIYTAGNPRFDLLKPRFSGVYDPEIKEIRKKYKQFVLVCTSFASCNHYICGTDYVQQLIDKKVLISEDSINIYKRYHQIKTNTLKSFLDAIPLIAKAYPATDVVIRPHPSESSNPYIALVKKYRNVYLEDKFSVHPWILSAKAVIHHYCTTSIEAFSAKTPSFAFRPEQDSVIEKEVPYACSINCKSAEELIRSLHKCIDDLNTKCEIIQPRKKYSNYVHNIDHIVASEIIVNEICRRISSNINLNKVVYNNQTINNNKYINFIRELSRIFLPKRKSGLRYISHKFDRLTVEEVIKIFKIFEPNYSRIYKCERVAHNIVYISQVKSS